MSCVVLLVVSNASPSMRTLFFQQSQAICRLKGKGLKLLHHYPDQLWAMGDKSVPNAGFTPARIFPQVPHARNSLLVCAQQRASQAERMPGNQLGGCSSLSSSAQEVCSLSTPASGPRLTVQDGGNSSSASSVPAMDAQVAGLTLSDGGMPQASNGHAEAAPGAASDAPEAAAAPPAIADAAAPNAEGGPSPAASAPPPSQDALIEVWSLLQAREAWIACHGSCKLPFRSFTFNMHGRHQRRFGMHGTCERSATRMRSDCGSRYQIANVGKSIAASKFAVSRLVSEETTLDLCCRCACWEGCMP